MIKMNLYLFFFNSKMRSKNAQNEYIFSWNIAPQKKSLKMLRMDSFQGTF